jgi:hypothetical protein
MEDEYSMLPTEVLLFEPTQQILFLNFLVFPLFSQPPVLPRYLFLYNFLTPNTVVAQTKGRVVLELCPSLPSSNPTRGMEMYVCSFCVGLSSIVHVYSGPIPHSYQISVKS